VCRGPTRPLGLVPSGAIAPALGALPPAPRALPPAQGDVEGQADTKAVAWSVRAVAPALESGRVLSHGRYRQHYRVLLGPVGGSDVLLPD
jgi:hypothetical protein